MKYNGDNIFVAECKFWGGKERHKDTIEQLFKYLTWRDSKAAIFVFIRGAKDIKSILDKIKKTTEDHDYCLKTPEETNADGWYKYTFSFKNDKSISFKLSIICFCL